MTLLAVVMGLLFFVPIYLILGIVWLRYNPEVRRSIQLNADNETIALIASLIMALFWPLWSIYIGIAYARALIAVRRRQLGEHP
jgi:hypothetical protein